MNRLTLAALILLAILAAILNFLPHLSYPFPIHVDEYVHFQYANHLSSGAQLYFGGEEKSLEEGFHYLLAVLNSLGVQYLFMFRFFASLITIFICLGIFILARKLFSEKAALFSVLFIALLQSTAMILGPAFFVPMAIGMFFITICLFLIEIESPAWMLILASTLIIHPPTAMALLLLINIDFAISDIKRKNYIRNILFQGIACLIALPFYLEIFLSRGMETINYLAFIALPGLVYIPRFLGWLIVAIALIGVYYSARSKKYSLAAYIIVLLFFILAFYRFKIEVFIPYRRALMYLFLILALPFGLGCEKITGIKDKKIRMALTIFLLILLLLFSLQAKVESAKLMYHIIEEKEYSTFLWLKENTDKDAVILADPWKANALTPLAERMVYSRIVQGPSEKYEARNQEISEFFRNNCTDTEFLKKNNITAVYNPDENCKSDYLSEIYPGVYAAKEVKFS